ncbi:Guanine nucleotide exchange factor lte1 [Malassezia cuniculi]|uniref:Guanine nucleotide exchange factor lte1 n=1 Tax=Malassezia cuniculi TaxID=948313 RepID=A0AAF0EU39_9BASI|nr:Guanine nucleotide exchange factor lte1 [Malassezia cuniculi]
MDPARESNSTDDDILSRVPAPLPGRALRNMRIRTSGSWRKSSSSSNADSSGEGATSTAQKFVEQQPIVCDWLLGPYILIADDPSAEDSHSVLTLDSWEVLSGKQSAEAVSAVMATHIIRPKDAGDPPGRIPLSVHNVLSSPPGLGKLHAQEQIVRTVRDYTVSADAMSIYYDKGHVVPLSVSSRNAQQFPIGKEVLIAATLRRLVAAMTSWTNYDETGLLVDVLLTFRSYVSAMRLFELLQSRFEWAAHELAATPSHTLAANVLQNTYTALRFWVEHYYHTDFRGQLAGRLSRWTIVPAVGDSAGAVMAAEQLISELQAVAREAADKPSFPSAAATLAVQTSTPSLRPSRSMPSLLQSAKGRLGSIRSQRQKSEDASRDEVTPPQTPAASPSRTLRLRKSLRRMRRLASGSQDSSVTGSPTKTDTSNPGSPLKLRSRSGKKEADPAFSLANEQDDLAQMEAALASLEERISEDKRRENLLYPTAPRARPIMPEALPSARNALFFSLRTEYVAQLLDSLEAEFLRSTGWLDVAEISWDQPQSRLGSWEPIYRTFINRSIDAVTGRGAPPQGGALVLIARFNVASSWIACQIVRTSSRAERSRLMAKWIMVAWHCYCHNNIASVCQIMFALQLPAISRLSSTWEELTEGEARVFDDLRHFVSPLDNFKHLRDHMQTHLTSAREGDNCAPYIPFFGLFVADLASNDTLASYTDATLLPNMMPLYDDLDLSQSWDALINVYRMRTKATIIRDILTCQKLVPSVFADSSAPFYAEAWRLDCLPEADIIRLSEIIEPSGGHATRTTAPITIGSGSPVHSFSS